ncbi:hypothetical protein [Lignipirellula cremea]|uniref:Uncharacterized protein n=1 Tax=Lignipirellula cremea TaxID=2528010 RepID=A0A518DZB6_9BACT|nr:hypothetical protein [Lignipirellula cremea]QDU97188.1 hypothetical protein Pla8534_50330 [Lignipirellula cremea]
MNPLRFPLMTKTAYEIDREGVGEFARRVGWIDDRVPISEETSSVVVLPLSWWEGVDLVMASDAAWDEKHGPCMGAWMRDDRLHRLDGTSPPIHTMNANNKPDLGEHNVLEYLGFFCYFVHGEHGPFFIVESEDDDGLPADLPEAMRAKLPRKALLLRPATNGEATRQHQRGFHCEAMVWYSDALFLANFFVREDGMVEMLEDEHLASETGVKAACKLKFD